MIHEVTGDLLLSRAEMLVQGLAPNDDCKQGLARALRERFPSMYKDFRHWCHQENPAPGSLWAWRGVDAAGKQVRLVALLTQEPPAHKGGHPGKAHTEYLNHALHELRKLLIADRPKSVAMPALATGVGRLTWEHVLPLLRTQLGDLQIPIFVYARYAPGVAAQEPIATAL
jgi:O-acetyl-ADP-ribose deacetylase (regulator of RNase III)